MTAGTKVSQGYGTASQLDQETQLSFACGRRQSALIVQNLPGIVSEGNYADFRKHFRMDSFKLSYQSFEGKGNERRQICLAACLDMIQVINVLGTILIEVVRKGIVTPNIYAGLVKQETFHRPSGTSVAITKGVDADHVEVGNYRHKNRIPRGGRAGIEPPEELSHQSPNLITCLRRSVCSRHYRVIAIASRLVMRIVYALSQDTMKLQYQRFRNWRRRIFSDVFPYVKHQRFGISGFLFLALTSWPKRGDTGWGIKNTANFLLGKFRTLDAGRPADCPANVELVKATLDKRRDRNSSDYPGQGVDSGQILYDSAVVDLKVQIELNIPIWHLPTSETQDIDHDNVHFLVKLNHS